MGQRLMTDIHKEVISLDTQEVHPKKYIRRRVIRKNLVYLKGLVVDIGGGRGEDIKFMKNASRVIGYDLDSEILRYYSRKNNVAAVAGDAANMPFKSESVTSINCIDVLEHIPDYKSSLSEAYRILERQGVIVISVPTDPRLFSKRDEEVGHQRLFDTDTLINDVKEAGFRITGVKKYGTLIYPYVKYVANRMSVKELHGLQKKRSFVFFKFAFKFFLKWLLNLDYYIPQVKNIGVLIVAVK